jgi:hypothetical protein
MAELLLRDLPDTGRSRRRVDWTDLMLRAPDCFGNMHRRLVPARRSSSNRFPVCVGARLLQSSITAPLVCAVDHHLGIAVPVGTRCVGLRARAPAGPGAGPRLVDFRVRGRGRQYLRGRPRGPLAAVWSRTLTGRRAPHSSSRRRSRAAPGGSEPDRAFNTPCVTQFRKCSVVPQGRASLQESR